ncbi:MAG: restriction endonuclease subunit S [Bacteroidales bacterium]
MTDWKEIELREICSNISYGYTASANIAPVGPKFLRITDISKGRINWETVPYCKISIKDSVKYKLEIGDIVIARTGATTGYNTIIKNEVDAVFASYLIRYKVDKEIAEPFFVGYVLQSNRFQDYVDAIAGGSAQPGANAQQFADFEFLLPTLPEQFQIASILSSLDNKIDLLHRQNKTLEQLAETMFRQWFVEETEESWETKKVKDVCTTISKGTTPTTLGKQFKEIGINFIKAESLTDEGGFISEKFAFIDNETDELLRRSRIQKEDILITIAGTIGRIAHVTEDVLPANTNQAIGFMRANKEIITPYFIYCLFKTSEIRNDFEGRVIHAVQPNLSLGEIGDIEFKMPPKEKLEYGMHELSHLFNKKEKNTNQIRTLTQLRDTLLPKLMSGEVRVKIN